MSTLEICYLSDRAAGRLLGHCWTLGGSARSLPSARERLEAAIGATLTGRLLASLAGDHRMRPRDLGRRGSSAPSSRTYRKIPQAASAAKMNAVARDTPTADIPYQSSAPSPAAHRNDVTPRSMLGGRRCTAGA